MNKIILSVMMMSSAVLATPSLIPQPVDVKELGGTWELNRNAVISYADATAKQPAELLAAQLRLATGFKLPIQSGSTGDIVFQTVEDAALGQEGYAVRVADRVSIMAPTATGLFYGAQTLRQLLPPEIYSSNAWKKEGGQASSFAMVSADRQPAWEISTVEIRDFPRFGWRGVMLDVSRYFFGKEFMLRYIDMMAVHKLNVLHWHLIDDAGWRIEIKKYPKLTEIGAFRGQGESAYGGFYTQEDIREIVQYAAERNIMIVPEVEIPAHTLAAIAAYPQLSCSGKVQTVPASHSISRELYCAGKESTWEFLEDVMDEVCSLFPGKYVHIGGDEARYDRWEKCASCQAKIKELNLKGEHELQGWMTRRIETSLKKHGKAILGWDEILDCGVSTEAGIMVWHKPSAAVEGANRGNPVVMALTGHCYFDAPESYIAGEPPCASWIPPISLRRAYEWDPVPAGLKGDAVKKILGAQGCVWTDQFLHNAHVLADKPGKGTAASEVYVEYLSLPRLAALAEVCWTPQDERSWADFSTRMALQYNRYDARDWNYRTPLPVVAVKQNGEGDFVISATAPMRGATVRYTLNGSAPTAESVKLTEAIGVADKMAFRAVTVAADGKRTSLVFDFEEKLKPLYSKLGALVGKWSPETVAPVMTFKATGKITENGTYRISFAESKKGAATKVTGLKLLKNGNPVAEGKLLGATSKWPKADGVDLVVSKYETGAEFVLEVSMNPGGNHGYVLLKQ
jgi:hexosaminidase